LSEITFTGSLVEVEKKAQEWKAANPHVRIIDDGPPIKVGYWDGHKVFENDDWSITVKYEGQSSN